MMAMTGQGMWADVTDTGCVMTRCDALERVIVMEFRSSVHVLDVYCSVSSRSSVMAVCPLARRS